MPYTWDNLAEGVFAEFCFVKLDIAGHSKIAKNNPKDKVSTTLDKFEEYVENHISNSGGQLWTWQGDGGLAAFLERISTKNAVWCAFKIIDDLDNFNKFVSKIEDEIRVRIAVHLGTARFREQKGRIHSDDINFVCHMEEECASPNDVCISQDVYTELDKVIKKQFQEVDVFEGKQVYSKQGKIRDKIKVHVGHRGLPKREDTLEQYLHEQLRIFSTTADNYFADPNVLSLLQNKLDTGCRFRVLLLNPNSEFMKDRERQEMAHFIDRQKVTIENIKILKNKFDQQIELRFFNCSPTYQALIINDHKVLIAVPLYGTLGTAEFPCLEIVNGPVTNELFTKFTQSFEKLWEDSEKVI